ncbi:putative CDC16 [Trypanosoma rangeli]|uniref:Putative CDC16 n=1 Tax=Trypanosoma rangeli TaxID=5698 RepID=A0A422NIF3_TRYRA|nr:putative CDC16 [Trypanosoma rangeli]RNF05245.1 putative CDC16 [Trypanosoma rangeli]|eukprot:RNF05245.1 putative CDC16 [Trypanosoma rangeli]
MKLVALLESNARRFLESDQPLSALSLTATLREVKPNSPRYSLLHAKALFAAREYDLAMRLATAVLSDDAENPEAVLLVMKSAYELGDTKESAAFADRLKQVPFMNVMALCYLGKCAELSGDTKKAAYHYQMALEMDPFCGEAMSALIERKLLNITDLRILIDSLRLPPEAEVLRVSYRARLPFESVPQEQEKYVPRAILRLQAAAAEYERNDLQKALSLTTELLEMAPFDRGGACLHLSILVNMKATSKLFDQAHFLANNKAHVELAVYAMGCFHFSLSNYERAGRFFSRATELDASFAEAWIAYGHCYAKLEEGEQALDVYRRAMNYFPGLPCCSTFVGMQYGRIHQWGLASYFLEQAIKIIPDDPLVLNEIGVLNAKTHRLQEALNFFRMAYQSLSNPENPSEYRDCIIFNLATVCRKLKQYDDALSFYTLYVKCRPNAGHGHCALAFTYHLMGNMKAAIAQYHIALSVKADSFCRDMLDRALATEFKENTVGSSWGPEGGLGSPSPDDVSFLTVSRTLGSESMACESMGPSPGPSLGRSLPF